MTQPKQVVIGGASGAWGDSPTALGQLLPENPDYLIMDYLAEVTMSLLARARAKDPDHGYPPDFIRFLAPHLAEIKERGVKIVTNAGGMNPQGAARSLRAAAEAAGVSLRIFAVEGDDVEALLRQGQVSFTSVEAGSKLPLERLVSANAYTGAAPIRAALEQGADIVITGRCADSALALGALQAAFGWQPDDFDRAATASLIGHILECGSQATGGTNSDWHLIDGWDNIGYPLISCAEDGTFEVYKPAGTGGKITPPIIAEQILYEVGDPAHYLLPDVTADFTQLQLTQSGADRVKVTGARGRAPTDSLKVSATWQDGYRLVFLVSIVGPLARLKAEKTAAALLGRGKRIIAQKGAADFDAVYIEPIGAEASYLDRAAAQTREVLLRAVFQHQDKRILDQLALEAGSVGLGCSPGITGIIGGRPKATPVIRLHSCLLAKTDMPAQVMIDDQGGATAFPVPSSQFTPHPEASRLPDLPELQGDMVEVPLLAIAYARSGDKGNSSNIAIFARDPDFYPILVNQVDEARILQHFGARMQGPAQRFAAPGLNAINLLIENALGGGGIASMRIDPQGKSYGQVALEMPVRVPADWVKSGRISADPFGDIERSFA